MAERILMKGNEAMAEAAIRARCLHFFGYPITPQTEVAAYMSKQLPKLGGTYMQAESEIAAINMVIGAASAGKRAMTSSSSPGVALKAEGISYLAGCDLPCLIMNVQRGGPGLGGIQPSQADYWMATKAAGHGDFHILVFAPATVQEMVDTIFKAFDKADQYRMPSMILADGLLGQMMEPVQFPEDNDIKQHDKSWAANGHGFKRTHNVINSLYLDPAKLESTVRERFKKYDHIKETEAEAECFLTDDADIILTAYGATARIARSAVTAARAKGIKAGLIRPITLWPFPEKIIRESSKSASDILCVEMSMGQMVDDVKMALRFEKEVHFYGRTGGIIPTPAEILLQIEKLTGGAK